ncbi:phage holin family protein [Fusibacter sp. JL216-2]|uniref:phage holin family protein n=1 Tax=Fusibacter sp. JL216-2 TaxID=3071453 RepID=UPI003D340AB5
MTMTLQDLLGFLRPETFILVPVIWYIGSVFKKNDALENWIIPFLLLFISSVLSISWFVLNMKSSGLSLGQSVWNGAAQGVVIAMVSDYFFNLQYQGTVKRSRNDK